MGLLAAAASVSLSGCGIVNPRYRYRYKMTAEVDTPSGVRKGSAVHEIEAGDTFLKLADGDKGYVGFRGEAFPVDLGSGKTLFVLVSSSNPGEESLVPAVQSAFDSDYHRGAEGNIATARKLSKVKAGTLKVALRPTNSFERTGRGLTERGSAPLYPLMVRFTDEHDPRTVEEVKPDALEASFGAGYRLKQIVVEITDEPVSDRIVQRLSWLINPDGSSNNKTLSGMPTKNRNHPTLSESLTRYNFKREYR